MQTCETVQVQTEVTKENPYGYIVINKSDFIAEVHKIYENITEEVKKVAQKIEEDVDKTL